MALKLLKFCSRSFLNSSESRSLAQRTNGLFQLIRKESTGAQEIELPQAQQRGERGKTKDSPVVVASYSHKCIVGCVCSPDAPTVRWFYIEQGPAQVCQCGYYFKLDRVPTGQWIPEYSRIMSVRDGVRDPRVERTGMPFQTYMVEEEAPSSESDEEKKS